MKKPKDDGNKVPEWVVTYGDLMSLLLCFFILLAAFSELKQEREFRRVLDSIKEAFGFRGGIGVADIDSTAHNSTTNLLEERARFSDDRLESNVNWEDNIIGRHEKTSIVQDGTLQVVGTSIPFDEAAFELTRAAQDRIKTDIAPKIKGQRFVVYVVGHAWGEREKLGGFGHEELGFKRALAVREFLVRECGVDPLILRVMSAGAQEPVSLSASPVETPMGNRRVQVWQTGRTVDQTHPDPNFTSAGAD